MGTINDLNTVDTLADDDKFVIWQKQAGATRAITAENMAAYFGAELSDEYQPLDATLTMYAALGMQDNKVAVGTGVDTAELVTYGNFVGDSSTVSVPAVDVLRTFSSTAAERIATMTLRNTGDAVGGQDYQNEVHLRMQAGTSATHRRYLDFMKFNGQPDFVFGANASSVMIGFDEDANQHWLWKENGSTLTGDTMLNATGATGKIRFGYHAADTLPPGDFRFHRGGAVTPANNRFNFQIDAGTANVRKYDLTGLTQQFIINATGDVGIGKDTPSYKLDIETSAGTPFRMVWSNGSFTQAAHSCTWTTTGTNASDMLTMTDGDNSSTRAILRLRGNAGAVEAMFAASNGNIGINTVAPAFKLDVEGAIKITPGTSVTPPDNGDVVIEFTNNTTLTFKGKGSDGTVRSATLTLT